MDEKNHKSRRSSGKVEIASICVRIVHVAVIVLDFLKDNWF